MSNIDNISNNTSLKINQEAVDELSTFYSNPDKNIMIADMDEILVNISPKWVGLMYKEKDYFSKYFNLDDDYIAARDYLRVLYRPVFYLDGWLTKKDVDKNTEEYHQAINHFMDIYDNDTFYDDLGETILADSLRTALSSNRLNKLYIVSRCTPNNIDSKKRFISRIYEGQLNKISFWNVDSNDQKSDVIKNFNDLDKVAALYEDENKNIADILTNTPLNTIKVYSPDFGYNHPNQKLKDIISENDSTLTRYEYVINN